MIDLLSNLTNTNIFIDHSEQISNCYQRCLAYVRYISQDINDVLSSSKGVETGGHTGHVPSFFQIQFTCPFAAHRVALELLRSYTK